VIARRVARSALGALCAIALLATPAGASAAASSRQTTLLERAANSLVARHLPGPGGGWAWRSAIQAPHLFTDRDVGTAGIAMGLLAAYRTTHRRAYLDAARHGGDWLIAAAQPTPGGGLRWPDWRDARGVSDTHFTSFDDGTPGIADLLWRLDSVTLEG